MNPAPLNPAEMRRRIYRSYVWAVRQKELARREMERLEAYRAELQRELYKLGPEEVPNDQGDI